MFILSLTYVKPQEEADRLMEPHLAWVKQGYDIGMFLALIPKNWTVHNWSFPR